MHQQSGRSLRMQVVPLHCGRILELIPHYSGGNVCEFWQHTRPNVLPNIYLNEINYSKSLIEQWFELYIFSYESYIVVISFRCTFYVESNSTLFLNEKHVPLVII